MASAIQLTVRATNRNPKTLGEDCMNETQTITSDDIGVEVFDNSVNELKPFSADVRSKVTVENKNQAFPTILYCEETESDILSALNTANA